MDMNSDARAIMNRWRKSVKSKERRIFRFDERVNLRLDAIYERMITAREPLPDWQIRQVRFRGIDHYEPIDVEWRTIHVGDTWGGSGVSAFFRRRIVVPERMAGEPVTLRFYVGGDSLLRIDSVAYHGLDPFRSAVRLPNSLKAGQTLDIEVESYVHWHSGEGDLNVFQIAELVVIDAEIEAAYWDFVAAFKVLAVNNIDERLQGFLEKHLWDALLHVPTHTEDFETFKAGCLEAQAMLRKTVYQSDRFKGEGLLHLVGHSHLDIVFMWPYQEYIRKIGRTHATMLRLMEQYPDFKFSQSSAKIYADMKVYFPEIYAQVKQRIAEGRWEAIGAFWVEPDCNLISGESFVRQIMYGQRFWHEEFGVRSKTCWQPDVFGMSWAMPQILRRSGIETMMTNKFFVWNDTNRWRKNTFWWEGPDGSRVLSVIPPGHFIGMVDPDHMDNHWRDFSDKETVGESLYCYGWGDGGGGVDPEMLECAVRYQDFPGLVPVQFSHPEEALLSIAEKAKAAGAAIPVWRDEMYLEAHRGTFTNKGRLKKLNRRNEQLYREAEMLAAFAWLEGASYPAEQLDEGWRTLLTTQFHDSLPGTHISEVYPYLLDEYDRIQAIGEGVRDEALRYLSNLAPDGENLLVFNSLPHVRKSLITLDAAVLDGKVPANGAGDPSPHQTVDNLDGTRAVLVQLDAGQQPEPVSMRVFALVDPAPLVETRVMVEHHVLENAHLHAEFSDQGELVRLFDKSVGREVLAAGERGNRFQMYEDKPGKYDAWDIVASYVQHEIPIAGKAMLEIDETGPLRGSLRLTRRIGESTLVQRISLAADSRGLTFETQIDWHERQRLLKVGFPVAINADRATYDIAYGNIQRPTHRNTPYDAARFEVPAHWWMDMSEADYGVALLNDCKYGHEANGHWMRLTLLKGSVYPDPDADRETHHFIYVLYPHHGDWRAGGVQQMAAELNVPLIARGTRSQAAQGVFMFSDAPNVTLEAVKRSEDGGSLIVRLVERYNSLRQLTVHFDRPVAAAWTCDLMEHEEAELTPEGSQLSVTVKPYEIITLKIRFGAKVT
ncbi:MAG: alpha-mannosidase [Anaerolineae bacterium]